MRSSTHHSTLLLACLSLTSLVSAIPGRDVLKCLQHNKVPFIISNSPNWTDYTTPHNLRLQYEPAVITIPETSQQVSASVKCAVAARLKVQPKGGGHSYASYSSGGQDGSLIVDMEKFDMVDVDQCKSSPLPEV
jgi:FAD/FMN-containing dehydrogenase